MYPITYWGSVPFAAPHPHRCAAFPKVRFRCTVGREEGRGRGREEGGSWCGATTVPTIHHPSGAGAACRTHARAYLCDPPWDHLICLPEGVRGDPVKVAEGHPTGEQDLLPDQRAITPSNWHFAQCWRGMQSVWTQCERWRGADGVLMGSKHALQPYRTATFPFFPQCWRGFQRVGGQKWVLPFVSVHTTL